MTRTEAAQEILDIPGLPNKALYRVDEVAGYFSVTERTIRLWIEHKHLEAKKIGGVVRIPRESIEKCGSWIKSRA